MLTVTEVPIEGVEELDNQPFMIRDIQIENFRCFEKVEIKNLGLINVIVGNNASGKTALLESIFLTSFGQHDALFRMRNWRGLGTPGAQVIPGIGIPQNLFYSSIERDLFSRFHKHIVISIELIGDHANARKLKIFHDYTPVTTTFNPNVFTGSSSGQTELYEQIAWEFSDHSGQNVFLKIHPSGQLIPYASNLSRPVSNIPPKQIPPKYAGSAPICMVPSSFPAAVTVNEPAQLFSNLSTIGEDKIVRDVLSEIFPQISDLSIEVIENVPILHCSVVGSKNIKLPIQMISSGISKLLSILLMIAKTKNGTVLIDEIDNGLYYTTLQKVWESILRFAKIFTTQVFVTTHSKECLQKLLPVVKENENDFRLIRMVNESGIRDIRVFTGSQFEAALESDYEVR